MSKLVDIRIPKQQPESISVTCSCLKCDSITCFTKRHISGPCTCENCNKPKTCRYYTTGQNENIKPHSDQITAVYLNAGKRKLNNEFEELTEYDINYESERQRILETNQPTPHSLNEYLNRLLSVTKVSSKYKHKPSSLSGYIAMISENSEYKKKMNLLKGYVQSLKESKPTNYSEDLENFETFTNAISPKLYRYQQLTEKRRGKCKSKCKGKCKHKQTLKNLDITQAQSVMVTCPQITHSPGTKSQTNNVPYESSNCSATCRTNELPTSEENSLFKYDIFKRLKEAYQVCSCKVCECIPTKLTKDDVCNCKPCECAECTNSTLTKITSNPYTLPSNQNSNCYRIDNNQTKLQSLKDQKECFCVSCECAQCVKNNLEVPCDQCKQLTAYEHEEVISNRYTTCTCLPCDCIECEHRNGAGRVFSEKQLYNVNHPTTSINEIYHHGNTTKKNNPHDVVTMFAGIPPLNPNVGFDNTYSKSCICKECECLKCGKEDTINSIKSSRFFSYDKHTEKENVNIEKSSIFTKPNYSHIYSPNPCKNKRERIHQYNSDHVPCCACDECIRLEKEMPLYYCKCGTCRCERCYGHAFLSNYSVAGTCLLKKGDVLTASAHQTKVQKQILKTNTASEIHENKSLCVNLNSNVNPQYEDIDCHSTSKNKYPQGLHQASIIRRVKKDTGTMYTKSLDRWNILQCDAYVNSQTWNISKPLLKNNFTDTRSGSYTSIYSFNKSASIENEGPQSGIENKNSLHHSDPDNLVEFTAPMIKEIERDSKADLQLNTHGSIPVLTNVLSVKQDEFNDILKEVSSAHNKDCETRLGFEPTNSNSAIQVPMIDSQLSTHGSIPVLTNVLSVKQDEFNDILTEASSAHGNDCETRLGFEPTNSYSIIEVTTESDENKRNQISDFSLKNKYNIHLNSEDETKIDTQKDDSYQSIRLTLELPNIRQTKCLSDPALTSQMMVKTNDPEEIPKDKSSKSSNNNGDNYDCFHKIENCTKYSANGYVYTHKKLPKENLPDTELCTAKNLLDIDDDYRRVHKTLADAKKFSLHLISVLKMYEKANKEFEKVSDKLKISYEAVFGDKIALKHEKCDIKLENFSKVLHSNTNLYLNETTTPDYKQTLFENIIIKRSDDCRISQKQELTNLSKVILNQNSSYEGYGILEKVSVVNKRPNVLNAHKNLGRIGYDNVHNKQSNEIVKSNYISNPDYESTFPTHEDETVAEIKTQQNVTQDTEDSKPVENIELRSPKTTSVYNPEKDTHKTLANKEIDTKMLTVSMNSFGCTTKPISVDKGEGVSEFPSFELGVRDTMDLQKNSTYTIKSDISYENKALNQLHSEVKKLLELTILEPLNFIEDTADSLKELSTIILPQSFSKVVNVKIDAEPIKQIVNPAADVNKEISCDRRKFMNEFKKQIRVELQVACAHPLLNKGSNLGSYSSNGECDDQKARFLMVHKVSEHTALVRWSEPRELIGVKGYELLVDGRTIQKIFNPSKCITAVTCLPHTDKILLTIRTITTVLPDAGHYPSTTIIYRPRLQ